MMGRHPLEDSGTDEIIILKWILNKYGVWTGIICLRTGSIASGIEHNTELIFKYLPCILYTVCILTNNAQYYTYIFKI